MIFASSVLIHLNMFALFINLAIAQELPLDLKQKLNHLSVYINQITNYILPTRLYAS